MRFVDTRASQANAEPIEIERGTRIMAKNRNTFEKNRREIEKKRKAEEKRERRRTKKDDSSPDRPPGWPRQ
jgi:hypothetical protein